MIEAYDFASKVHVAASSSNAITLIKSGGSIVDVENGFKHRDIVFKSWHAKLVMKNTADVPFLPPNPSAKSKSALGTLVFNHLKTNFANKGFAKYLINNTLLVDYTKLLIGMPQEDVFKCIVEGEHETMFNMQCQSVIEWCWLTLDNSLDAPNNIPHQLYFYNLHQKLVELNKETNENHPMHNSVGWSILHLILSKLVLGKVKHVFQTLHPSLTTKVTVDCLQMVKYDVN